MIATLTVSERQTGLLLSILLALMGLAMAAAARHGVMSVHGFMALGLGTGLAFLLAGSIHRPEPAVERMHRYYDAPTRFGIAMTLIWAMVNNFR